MSLNFVSSAVLTSSDGISHDKETAITNAATSSINRSSSAKPLYEQLRSNAEKVQEEYDEITRQMRGTRPLDEEDIAHLTTVENIRQERERATKKMEEDEVEMFRAARMEKTMERSELVVEEENDDDNNNNDGKSHITTVFDDNKDAIKNTPFTAFSQPKIIMKGKRRRKENTQENATKKPMLQSDKLNINVDKKIDENDKEKSQDDDNSDEGNLGGLLGGYGSDSSTD